MLDDAGPFWMTLGLFVLSHTCTEKFSLYLLNLIS